MFNLNEKYAELALKVARLEDKIDKLETITGLNLDPNFTYTYSDTHIKSKYNFDEINKKIKEIKNKLNNSMFLGECTYSWSHDTEYNKGEKVKDVVNALLDHLGLEAHHKPSEPEGVEFTRKPAKKIDK